MRFVTPLGTWPIAVRCNWWGDVCVACGFAAQEREYGFVVGEREPERDRLVDNSFFQYGDGARKPAYELAELFLHETTHVVWREGTVGFWNGVSYYLEAIFLFRYSNHSDERKARGTGEEFTWWNMHRELIASVGPELAQGVLDFRACHLLEAHDDCAHGPFPDPPPPAPIPPQQRP